MQLEKRLPKRKVVLLYLNTLVVTLFKRDNVNAIDHNNILMNGSLYTYAACQSIRCTSVGSLSQFNHEVMR